MEDYKPSCHYLLVRKTCVSILGTGLFNVRIYADHVSEPNGIAKPYAGFAYNKCVFNLLSELFCRPTDILISLLAFIFTG
jgi:hypothetical protein